MCLHILSYWGHSMTRLTNVCKQELKTLLSTPARIQNLRKMLEEYMPKTPYKQLPSFENALKSDHILQQFDLPTATGETISLYSSAAPADWNPYEVARALFPNGYFCNLTAVYHHALTNQVPSRIYVGIEAMRKKDQQRAKTVALSNHAIFEAFAQPHRMTKRVYKFQKHEIAVTERVGRRCVGVEAVHGNAGICPQESQVTSLERTLIEAVVHPQYNGGLSTVVDILRVGLKKIDKRRFLDLYEDLDYLYPYWQAIGFLCERLGFADVAAATERRFTAKNEFYLDHLAKTSWEFDPKWQIHYPKGVI